MTGMLQHHPLVRFMAGLSALAIAAVAPAASQPDADALRIRPSGLSEYEVSIWNNADFQRRFAESYIAETEIEPTVTLPERETMQEILDLIASEQLDEAAAKLTESRNEASSAVFDFTLANIYFQKEQLDEAAEAYQAAVDKFPKFLRAWKNLGIIRIRRNEFAEALPALTKVVELGGGDAVTYGLLGFAYSSVENFISAESAYRMAILLDPDTLDWKMGLARSFFKQERFGEAAALCGLLIKDEPDRVDLWLLQANAYIGMEKPLEAAEIFELVDHLGESTADSLNMLGDIYINEELYELAADSYLRSMEKAEDGGVDRALRSAKILSARGALDQTRRLVARIESATSELDDQTRIDVLKLKARLAVAEGAGEEEVAVLKEIVELDPLDGEALILLGQHSRSAGDDEQAIFYFERAAAIEGFEADAQLRHAQVLVNKGEYADALPLLRSAQQVDPRANVQDFLEQVERLAKSR